MAADTKILVTGSNGQLGSELKEMAASFPQFQFIFLNREEASIENYEAIKKAFDKNKPAYLINCSAYTAVDKAEEEKDQALLVNGTAVGTLAAVSKEYGTRLIHLSTDYVFDGNNKSPLKETDKANPINVYGETKLVGEHLALKNNPETIIIRTSWVYSSYGKNFVKTMIRLMKERDKINVVSDQYGSPTYAADLAGSIMQIIQSGGWIPGIYNYSNEGVITWYDFAVSIRDHIHSSCVVAPISTDQYPTPARRPKYSVLDKSKIQKTYSVQIKNWEQSLQICLSKMLEVKGRV